MKKFLTLTFFWCLIGYQSHFAQSFSDNFQSVNIGEVSSVWQFLRGNGEVDLIDGEKALLLRENTLIGLYPNALDYLDENFTIEFDLYFDEVTQSVGYQNYDIRLWSGQGAIKEQNIKGATSYRPITIRRHGVTTSIAGGGPKKEFSNNLSELRDYEPVWRRIQFIYYNQTLKVTIDGTVILNLPDYSLNPSQFSIETDNRAGLKKGLKNFQIDGFIYSKENLNSPSGTNSTQDSSDSVQIVQEESAETEFDIDDLGTSDSSDTNNSEISDEVLVEQNENSTTSPPIDETEENQPSTESPQKMPSETGPELTEDSPTQDYPNEEPKESTDDLEPFPTEEPDNPTTQEIPEDNMPSSQEPPETEDFLPTDWEKLKLFIAENYTDYDYNRDESVLGFDKVDFIWCDYPQYYDEDFRNTRLQNAYVSEGNTDYKVIFKNSCYKYNDIKASEDNSSPDLMVVMNEYNENLDISFSASTVTNENLTAYIGIAAQAYHYAFRENAMNVGLGPMDTETKIHDWKIDISGTILGKDVSYVKIKAYPAKGTLEFASIYLFGPSGLLGEIFFHIPINIENTMRNFLAAGIIVATQED